LALNSKSWASVPGEGRNDVKVRIVDPDRRCLSEQREAHPLAKLRDEVEAAVDLGADGSHPEPAPAVTHGCSLENPD
jgi:hypothetical protein